MDAEAGAGGCMAMIVGHVGVIFKQPKQPTLLAWGFCAKRGAGGLQFKPTKIRDSKTWVMLALFFAF